MHMAEWLRRWTANPMELLRASSNLVMHVFFFARGVRGLASITFWECVRNL